MIHLQDYLYEAELNLEWWNSKSPAYQKRYLTKHPNSIYAQKAKLGELEVKDNEKDSTKENESDTDNTEKLKSQLKDLQDLIKQKEGERSDVFGKLNQIKPLFNRKWEKDPETGIYKWFYSSPEEEARAKEYYDLDERLGKLASEVGELTKKEKKLTQKINRLSRKSESECKLDQVPLKIKSAEVKITQNQELEKQKREEYSQLRQKYDAIPMPIEHYNDDTGKWEWDSDSDRERAEERLRIRGHMRSVWAEVETAQHNQEVAKRYIRKLNSFANFTKRNLGPNTSTKYAESGVAQYVDFSGMNEDSENEIMDSITKMVEKHPFMKGHLTFIGSHKSSKFKQLSQELAHDYYKADLEKRYDEAQDYIKSKEGGAYTGSEKDPAKIYEDKEHWLSEDKRDSFHYYLYNLNEKYRLIERIDKYGGVEGYLRTPAYDKAIKRWQRMSGRAWAYYRTDELKSGKQGMIAFNENSFDSAELKKHVESKWHPEGCDTKKAILDHEFSHSIWWHLGLNKEKPYGTSPLQDYVRQQMHFGKEYIKNHLSQYAATNPNEFFAEAYSEYLNNPQPREIARKVGELLQKEIQLQGYGDKDGSNTGSQS